MAGRNKFKAGEADGSSAVAHELDTQHTFSTSGAKLLSIKNAGVEKLSIDKDGNVNPPGTWVVRPEEGSAGITAAVTAAHSAGGGVVQLLAGTYAITSPISNGGYWATNVVIQGKGDSTILDVQSGAGFPGSAPAINLQGGQRLGGMPMVAPVKGDTSVVMAPGYESYAGWVTAGDRVWLVGYLDGKPVVGATLEAELHFAAADGNPSTGEIQLTSPVLRTLNPTSTLQVHAHTGGTNNAVKDLRIRYGSGTLLNHCIWMACTYNSLVENVTIENFTGTTLYSGLSATYAMHLTVRNCRFTNLDGAAIDISGQFNLVERCVLRNVHKVDGYYSAALRYQGSWDTLFRNNILESIVSHGISMNYGSGASGVRNTIESNEFTNIKYVHAAINSSYGGKVINNIFDGCTDAHMVTINGSVDHLVQGNIFRNGVQGVYCGSASDRGHVITGNTFEDMTTYEAISLQAGEDIIVSNNAFYNVNTAMFISPVNKSVISGNVIDGCSYGIATSGDGVAVMGNRVVNATTASVFAWPTTNSTFMGNDFRGGPVYRSGTGNDWIGNKE